MKKLCIALSFVMTSLFSWAQYPGQHNELIKVDTKIPIKAYNFNLQDIHLLDSRFKQNMDREAAWLLSLPNERLLHSFYVNAGMLTDKKDSKTKMPKPLGGWEALDMELRGHSIGHILSGLSFQYASTGNIAFRNKTDSLITALALVQKTLNQNGFLSAYPQNYIDRNIAATSVWAPWYTLHKIFSGLTDVYLNTGNPQALDIVTKMADWAYQKLSPLSPDALAKMLRNEFGGMNEAFYNLYAITANPKHLQQAEMFYHHAVLDPLAAQEDKLNGMHANTIIPKIVGEARAYELTANAKYNTIATFFWNTIIRNHTYVIGSNSDKEHFFQPGKISEHLTGNTGETCNTYNMLKVTKHLFSWYADAKYADYYEQTLYNHILGQQDPVTGMVCYFTPLKAGAFKLYSSPDNSFWCCVGSGFESHSKFGEAIYYHDNKGIYVNLFIPSLLTWKEKEVTLLQETRFPDEATTTLTIQTAGKDLMSLYLRYPSWAVNGAFIKVNGKKITINQPPGSYIAINRKWNKGDKIEITYPMSLMLVPTPDNPNIAAVVYGPIVLASPMGTEGMKSPAPYHDSEDPYQYYGYDYNIPSNIIHTLNVKSKPLIASWLQPVENEPLTFKTLNGVAEKEIIFKPYNAIHRERYVVYWDLK